jgi:D-3-phosphoglycerate dehydrogenase
MQLASDRGWNVAAVHDRRSAHLDTIRIDVETDSGITTVEGAVVLGKPRLIHVDGIYCEAPLAGPLVFLKNVDVPGVVGHIGAVLGSSRINIANFSLGRSESEDPVVSIAVVRTDSPVPQDVVEKLTVNPAVKTARFVHIAA